MTAPAVVTTAPAASEAPAQAVPTITPVFERAEEKPQGLNAMIEKIARDSEAARTPDAPVLAEATTVPEMSTGEPTAPAPVSIGPEGEIRVDGDDITLKAERNADGTFKTQIDPTQKFDIEMRDPETGEMRKYTKSMPEVLRMARDGVWGQKVKDEVAYYRKEVPQWQQTHEALSQETAQLKQTYQQLNEQLQAQMELNRELLTAPDEFVIQRREEFAHEMSPEQRLAKLEASLREREQNFRDHQEREHQARQADSFIQTRLAPVLSAAETALGNTEYARQLVAGQIALATTPLLQNGVLPPSAWGSVEAYLRGPFQEWVHKTAAYQQTQVTTSTTAQEQVRKAQASAQSAVNSAGQLLRPVGSVNGSLAPAPQGPAKNMGDAINRIINRPLAHAG